MAEGQGPFVMKPTGDNVGVPRTAASVAPPVLDPVLAMVERIDRTVRRIRPVRPGGLLGIEQHRHRGPALTLADGTLIGRGDSTPIIHMDNRRVRDVAGKDWQRRGLTLAREDLRALAVWHAAQPARQRPVAYGAVMIMAPLARRIGFEVRDRRRTPFVRLEDWYLRSLLARWARGGRERLRRGHAPLVTHEVWLSGGELLRRYASGSPPPE
jgi:hypothetical protein